MYNQTLPHGDEAVTETWEYHRNVAWTQVSWHSKHGTQPSFPVCAKGNASDCLIISMIRQVTCISRRHFLFLRRSSFPRYSCTTGKAYDPSVPHPIFVPITTLVTERRGQILIRVYPTLTKIIVNFAF